MSVEENKAKMLAAMMANAILQTKNIGKKSNKTIETENKRNVFYKDNLGHIVKRKGKYKNSDLDFVHYFCHVCGRLDKELVEVIQK